jgi:hypothetical protein
MPANLFLPSKWVMNKGIDNMRCDLPISMRHNNNDKLIIKNFWNFSDVKFLIGQCICNFTIKVGK